ncbi:hypothetical protein [Rummeliibacillus stabekisii]|uniref:hypothetical protein n=1 Tax=Rummeliibacillus stabekisii TaxID=241244 RepID=UPI00117314AB|nr:hypothetical protein [Rummeliibacillus stabekisii]MBB5171537.1 hypothetical protein [Rummeliibacillus stabekisii]GEL05504.1 hypothetical protein RST01_21310 [Rummeliibacillus stabekisii]
MKKIICTLILITAVTPIFSSFVNQVSSHNNSSSKQIELSGGEELPPMKKFHNKNKI